MSTDLTESLRRRFDGELIEPSDPHYDETRRLFNGRIDRRPALIARCRRVDDVLAAVNHAGERGLPLSVYGGGHGLDGAAVTDDALLIDLRPMREIQIDPRRRRATVEPGVTWGELDAATQAHGLAVTGARGPSIGVTGFTLGGGSGWLERSLGLACDNLISAEIITADGRLLTASDTEHPDLLWALRGGGAGTGVVTQLELGLHPVGPTVLAGQILHPRERAAELLALLRDFTADAPAELGIGSALVLLPDAPQLPEPLRGAPVIGCTVCFNGDPAAGERLLAPLGSFGTPIIARVAPVPYIEAQRLLSSPSGDRYHAESAYLEDLDDTRIATLIEHAGRAQSPGSEVVLLPWTGAIHHRQDSPLPRPRGWLVHVLAHWTDSADDHHEIAWAHSTRDAIAPSSTAAFPNLSSRHHPTADFGPDASERLHAIRRHYNPDSTMAKPGTPPHASTT